MTILLLQLIQTLSCWNWVIIFFQSAVFFWSGPLPIFKQKPDNEQSLQRFLCQKCLFSKQWGNYVCKVHVPVTCTVLTKPYPVPQWRAPGILNLLFKCIGKTEGFFSLCIFFFQWKYCSVKKRKPIGKKDTNSTEEIKWQRRYYNLIRHILEKIFSSFILSIIDI